MKKEHVKSIVLLLLIITNVCLGGQIWIKKKLWPNGYNFFANMQNSFVITKISNLFSNSSSNNPTKTHITTPTQIIINTGYQTTRFALNSKHSLFNKVDDVSYDILFDAFSSPARLISQVNQEEWYSVLMSKSIYLNYNIKYSTKLFSQFLGVKESELSNMTSNFTDIVISVNSSSNVIVYIKNDNTYFKVITSVSITDLDEIINYFQQKFDGVDTGNSMIINYSFDLKFDQAFGNQKAVLSPMIPIFSNPQSYEVIKSENPILRSDDTINTYAIDKILNLFEINPNAVRKYTEANGTIVYVENDSILKVSPEGILEYSAKNAENGIKLFNNSASSTYASISQSADFIDKLSATVSSNRDLFIMSDLTDEVSKNSILELKFDYSANGIPVIFNINNKKVNHAVEVTIENGYLKEYTHILRDYSSVGVTSQTPIYIDALDNSIKQNTNNNDKITVDEMYIGYIDDGSINAKNADWNIVISK